MEKINILHLNCNITNKSNFNYLNVILIIEPNAKIKSSIHMKNIEKCVWMQVKIIARKVLLKESPIIIFT